MAFFNRDSEGFSSSGIVEIVDTETVENYTIYVIQLNVGNYTWRVRHRYSEFHEMHEKLVALYKIEKTIFPPKKVFGNQNEAFIKKRQADLSLYLQLLLQYLARVPPELAMFLDFHRYEIHGITQYLAETLFNRGEEILHSQKTFVMSPLQLHAVTQRLKLPEPTCAICGTNSDCALCVRDSGDMKKDLGHILDFLTRLKYLKILGSKDPVGSSNIDMNQLVFEMTFFKSVKVLEVEKINLSLMSGVENLKKSVKNLIVHSSLGAIKDILLQDVVYWQHEDLEDSALIPPWEAMTAAEMSYNDLKEVDESVRLISGVDYLDLSHNQIVTVEHLHQVFSLTQLNLSHNRIQELDALHTKMGNIKILNLSGNQLESLQGLSKLYSLEKLDVSCNKIAEIQAVEPIGKLPCLENLILLENPVEISLDYRTKILELFGERAKEVCLDNEPSTQQEVDTVAVRIALKKGKDGVVKKQTTCTGTQT